MGKEVNKYRCVFKELCLEREDRTAAQRDPAMERLHFLCKVAVAEPVLHCNVFSDKTLASMSRSEQKRQGKKDSSGRSIPKAQMSEE